MSECKPPEVLAEEWLKEPLNIGNMQSAPVSAFLCGYDAGYERGHQLGKSRGKAEEQKRIWEEVQSVVYDELTLKFIREIIFAGGEYDNRK